ncbi:MAG: energy transducer TonB [Halopseudomonas sp.]
MSQTLPNPSQISSVDRFGFTLFVAIAVHALLILGLAFDADKPAPIATTLEVTLSQFKSEIAPEDADFIAQHNQVGSGEQQQKTLPTTREVAPFQNNEAAQVAPGIQPSQLELIQPPQPTAELVKQPQEQADAQQVAAEQPEQITTTAESERQVANQAPEELAAATPSATGMSSSLLARSLEIASLEAKLDSFRQERARAPRVRRLTSASTRESFDAQYLDSWRRKVERVGNLNYPEQARRRELYGNLRLLVVLRPDGSLERVDVLKSSGHKLLDDAAKRIVRLAAPYAAFPPELRKHADRVEIIRTWKFERSRMGINS